MKGKCQLGVTPHIRNSENDTGESPRLHPVRLRKILESDLPILFEHQQEPEGNRLAVFPARGRAAFMAHWHKIMADRKVMVRTILYQGQVAGYVMRFPWHGKQEVGYWIGKAFWGQGVATGALSQFLRHCKTRPLHAGVANQNLASRRVLEKCGFRTIGEEPEETVYRLE